MTAMLSGGFAQPSIDAASAFRAVLDAMARPGTVQPVPAIAPPAPVSVAMGAVLLTLCDHETPIWLAPTLAVPAVTDWVRFHTGAPLSDRAGAAFAFGSWAEMTPLADFSIGTPEYPDRSATLVVAVTDLGDAHTLTGPGIRDTARLTVPDAAALRANAALFPLGLDFILTAGDRVAGLPRTTKVGA